MMLTGDKSKIQNLKSKIELLFLIVFALLLANGVSAQTVDPYQNQIREFEQFVEKRQPVDRIPGISVGFIKDGVMWAKGFGYADLENKSPARAESMYRLASVTKPMTATAILQLVEQGKIDLNAEVQKYVPYFPKKKYPVTVGWLLGHLGGISHYRNYDLEGHFKDHKDTREAIRVFEDFELVAEPGTRFNYSSYGYNLLGAVIEGAAGMPYAEYMRKNVWGPLEMNDTVMDDPTSLIPNRVRGYQLVGGQIQNSEFVDISSRFAAGGTRSTVVDMLKFGEGTIRGKTLSPKSLTMMFSPMTTKKSQITYYGAGWGTYPLNGRFVISHSGGQQETATLLYVFPSRNLVIAIATNLEGSNRIPYIEHLFELLTGEDWNINAYVGDDQKKPLYQAMHAAFEEGRAHFEKTGRSFTDDERELKSAFAKFNQLLDIKSLQTSKDLSRQIAAERILADGAFVKIGSFMAKKLSDKYGAERLAGYSNTGAITFFDDYNKLAERDHGFNENIAKTIAAWQANWEQTNALKASDLVNDPEISIAELETSLRRGFAGESVYPNISNELVRRVEHLAIQRNIPDALRLGRLAADLYPTLDEPNANYGLLLTITGEKEKGKQLIRRAAEINSRGLASAAGLNGRAYDLLGLGLTDAGIQVLQTAVELYPNEANLYDSLGEFYLKKNLKDKAIEFYKKALETDPGYPNAENARAILKKLAGGQ